MSPLILITGLLTTCLGGVMDDTWLFLLYVREDLVQLNNDCEYCCMVDTTTFANIVY